MTKRYRPPGRGGGSMFVLYLVPPFAIAIFIMWSLENVFHLY